MLDVSIKVPRSQSLPTLHPSELRSSMIHKRVLKAHRVTFDDSSQQTDLQHAITDYMLSAKP